MIKLSSFLWLLPFFGFLAGHWFIAHVYKSSPLKAPLLLGKSLQEAVAITSQQSLNLRVVAEKDDPSIADGTIISQTPATQTEIKPNQTIYVVSSKKPRAPRAPDCINKSRDEIESLTKKEHLNIVTHKVSAAQPKGMCIAQFPECGSPVENSLILYVSEGTTKPVLMPNFIGKSCQQVHEFLSKHSCPLDIFHRAQPCDHQPCSCTVIDQRPLAGTILDISGEKPISVQVQVG